MDYLPTDRINTKRSSLSDPLVLLLWEYRGILGLDSDVTGEVLN